MIASRFVSNITVIDPDTRLPVEIEIRKLATGGMIGLDGSFLENTDKPIFSPYDAGYRVDVENG